MKLIKQSWKTVGESFLTHLEGRFVQATAICVHLGHFFFYFGKTWTHTHTHTHIHTRTHIHTHTHTGATYLVPAHKSKTDEGADGVILQSTMNLPTDKAGDVMKLHLYLSACSKRDGDDSITRHLRRGEVVELPGANDPVIYVHKIKFTCNSTSHLLTTQMHVSDYVRHGHCLS